VSGSPDHFILPAMPQPDGASYTSRCVCGWRSEPRGTWQAADALGDDHINAEADARADQRARGRPA
jgi:hypothetical protein